MLHNLAGATTYQVANLPSSREWQIHTLWADTNLSSSLLIIIAILQEDGNKRMAISSSLLILRLLSTILLGSFSCGSLAFIIHLVSKSIVKISTTGKSRKFPRISSEEYLSHFGTFPYYSRWDCTSFNHYSAVVNKLVHRKRLGLTSSPLDSCACKKRINTTSTWAGPFIQTMPRMSLKSHVIVY